MDRLSAMRTFVAVVETGGFSRAAQKLGLANASVTEAVKNLEEHLGVQLLNRTTRSLRPTYEGATYYARCRNLLGEIDELETMVSETHAAPKGRLVVEVPAALGHQYIVPALKQFSEDNPDIRTVVLLDPGPQGLVEGGIDVAVQLGELRDSNFIAKRVCNTRYVACASPDFIARHGQPKTPADLKDMNCLGFFAPHSGRIVEWVFQKGSRTLQHLPTGRLHFNSSGALIDVAIKGGGIIYILDLLVNEAIANGRLVPILTDWRTLRRPLFIVYPQKRYLPNKVKTFISFIERLHFGAEAG